MKPPMPPFKYSEEMSEIANCPPYPASRKTGKIYRFFHDDLQDEKNFLPPAKIKPNRKWKSDADKCDAYGLSLFFCDQKAERYYLELAAVMQNIRKSIGTCIVSADLGQDDGMATAEDHAGHFSLFEFAECDFRGRFNHVRAVG